ncbi:hypothetical protein K457DRAFT_483621 [Linnemannia elongata AG-77]|uniref:Uncharacterized protein n=1 Tax=Linnemannia elongata AG-77 TaxID=1314771 RepID=A0A197JWM8_9FUNG|nr:hypothetical protein K457DRAFT_483621 [Linnemannia elongata AG-77]
MMSSNRGRNNFILQARILTFFVGFFYLFAWTFVISVRPLQPAGVVVVCLSPWNKSASES